MTDFLDYLYVDTKGGIWLDTPPGVPGDGWLWLREDFYGGGPHFESGYDKPNSPVTPIRAYVRGIRHPFAADPVPSPPQTGQER
jgi:hypothetical protein